MLGTLINFNLFFWVNSEQHSPLKVASQLMRELVTEFTAQNISMPDDARERILLSAPDESDAQKPSNKAEQPLTAQQSSKQLQQQNETVDDVSSDTDEIRDQAENSRDPEQGKNII